MKPMGAGSKPRITVPISGNENYANTNSKEINQNYVSKRVKYAYIDERNLFNKLPDSPLTKEKPKNFEEYLNQIRKEKKFMEDYLLSQGKLREKGIRGQTELEHMESLDAKWKEVLALEEQINEEIIRVSNATQMLTKFDMEFYEDDFDIKDVEEEEDSSEENERGSSVHGSRSEKHGRSTTKHHKDGSKKKDKKRKSRH